MNPALLILLALGVVGLAMTSGSAPAPATPEDELVANAESMVQIFNFYSRKHSELSDGEREQLGRLNAAAKGVSWISEIQWANERGLLTTSNELYYHGVWGHYNQTYYLPPNANDSKGPDLFTAWLDDWAPWFQCTARAGGLGDPNPWCVKGTFRDGFFRLIGTYDVGTTVYGQSDLMLIGEGLAKQFADLWKVVGPGLLKAVASVASNYPGIGTAISVALTFVAEVGSGASVGHAALESAKAAIPAGIRGVYDLGVGLAETGKLDPEKAATVAMAFAISTGVLDGAISERYEAIKKGFDDAKSVGIGDAIAVAV